MKHGEIEIRKKKMTKGAHIANPYGIVHVFLFRFHSGFIQILSKSIKQFQFPDQTLKKNNICIGKSLSEVLLFAVHGENMLCTKILLNVKNNFCTRHVLPRFELGIFMYLTCN